MTPFLSILEGIFTFNEVLGDIEGLLCFPLIECFDEGSVDIEIDVMSEESWCIEQGDEIGGLSVVRENGKVCQTWGSGGRRRDSGRGRRDSGRGRVVRQSSRILCLGWLR